MTQTLAIFLDAYRELNARKLFWAVLLISALIVLGFAAIGINANGITLFRYEWPMSLNTSFISWADFYKMIFYGLGIYFWLTWAATILALVSTAGIFPDLLGGGSVDLYLSKPISRLRLFLTKYVAAMAFVLLQVGVFCLASFLVIGIRGGAWEPGVFIAVPVVVCFFSYLFAVCVLLGVVTRSTIAALLFSILFWLLVLGVHGAEVFLLRAVLSDRLEAAAYDRQIATQEQTLQRLGNDPPTDYRRTKMTFARRRLDDAQKGRAHVGNRYDTPHRFLYAAATVLPKTSETVELMKRWLVKAADLQGPGVRDSDSASENEVGMMQPDRFRVMQELDKTLRARSVSWVVETSLAFEAVVVGLAAWLFCRRDY